jgi:hypothetical protein
MQRLKDINVMRIDEARIGAIASKFQTGEATKQEAFDELVSYCTEVLEPFTEERKSGLKLVQGALKKLGKLMEGTILDTLNLSTTYGQPARQLAKAHIEGCPVHLQFVIDNLTQLGSSEDGDLPGPIFAPARLIVSMKTLRLPEDKSAFEVDDDNGLMLRDKSGDLHRFGALSIEGIKDILRTGTTDPETLDLIVGLVGEYPDKPDAKEKRGVLGRAIDKLAEAAKTGEEPDQFALDICETLETALDEVRSAAVRRVREERTAREAEADMERARKRLQRQQSLGAEREGVPASVAATDGSEAE